MKAGKPAFVNERFVGFDDAYRLVLELGGIPCYPVLGDGATPICPFEAPVEDLIARLRDRNIHAAEFIPGRNEPELLGQYVRAMRGAGLVVTAGTEHNTLDAIPIEAMRAGGQPMPPEAAITMALTLRPTCTGGLPIPEDVRDAFLEGAFVLAAHQFLTAHGECGFVDECGNAYRDYPDAHARIAAFADLGAAVVRRYRETYGRAKGA
jgi:hypothetical protein